MRDGFIKAAAMSPEILTADCEFNARSAIRCIKEAKRAGVRLLVLPELGLTGAACGDLFFQPALQRAAAAALLRVCEESSGADMLIFAGLPVAAEGGLFNCAAAIHKGRVLGLVPKANLSGYGESDEKRHFAPAPEGVLKLPLPGFPEEIPFGTGLLFCCAKLPEFCAAAELGGDISAPVPAAPRHCAAGAAVIANLSAGAETVGSADFRRGLASGQSARLVCGYVCAGAGEGESTTDAVFSGHCLIAENGRILSEARPFERGAAVTEIDVSWLWAERRRRGIFAGGDSRGYERICFDMALSETELTRAFPRLPFVPDGPERDERLRSILQIQANALKKRLAHTGARPVIGVSGGLDSSLALLVTVRAAELLGRPASEIAAVTMPGFGTTERTLANAGALCAALGTSFRRVDIRRTVTAHFDDIGHDPAVTDTTYENAQARERTQVLMDIANMENGLVIGTGDLSELALGWATYNGDHMSMYAVNAGVPKTLVRHLVAYEAKRIGGAAAKALWDILDTPVSPELLPPEDGVISQHTEELVGPYELHDFFLYYGIRRMFPPKKVFRAAVLAFAGEYGPDEIKKWLGVFARRFFAAQFKRSCMPDGPRLGSVGFSPRSDWHMPSDASPGVWEREIAEL